MILLSGENADPEDYDAEVDGDVVVDNDDSIIEDDERWLDEETSDEFLK